MYHDNMKREILLVEDDKLFAESLCDVLEEEGYEIDLASSAEKALEKSYQKNYSLFLFDINLPNISGIELLKLLRDASDNTPAIFLTSYKDDETLKNCFLSGCDDFLRKPVKIDELVLRIKAVLSRAYQVQEVFNLPNKLTYNFSKRAVLKDNKEIKLPLKVVELLELFIQNNNSIVTFEQIHTHLWSPSEDISEGSLRIYISKLRELLNKDSIKNIKKVGYKVRL